MTLPASYALPAVLPLAEPSEAIFVRIGSIAYAATEPGFRASGSYRFDDPGRAYQTLYCASEFVTCMTETLPRNSTRLRVPQTWLGERSLVAMLVDVMKLSLVDLFSSKALATLELDLAIVAGDDYRTTQALARLIHDHPSAPDGIVYRSRFSPDADALVLFERTKRKKAVRLYPGTTPIPLAKAQEATDAARRVVPYVVV